MAFDVAARLAEGAPAIADFENYVLAARALGYQSPELTMHPAQMRDLYGTEDGLDLRALDADAAALSRLASLAGDAMQAETKRMEELAIAWKGQAAESAREFLRRHQDSAAAVSEAVQRAAGTLGTLRDQLWHAVDAKVDAVQAIDGRCGPQRAEWLAAAHTVLSGGADRAVASEIVDQRVRPFVEGDIGSDWVSAMHASTASVAEAYDTAIATVNSDQATSFGVPGYVGPAWQPRAEDPTTPVPSGAAPRLGAPVVDGAVRVDGAVGQTVPAATVSPSPALAASAPPTPPPAVAAAPEPPPAPSGLGDVGGMPGLGAMPALGAGLSGLGRQLSDGLSGLTGDGRDALSERDHLDQQDDADDDDDDEAEEDDEVDDVDEEEDEGGERTDEDAESNGSEHAVIDPENAESPVNEDLSKSTDTSPPPTSPAPPPPIPTPSPEPPPADQTPGPSPPARTPCEIAADEVPQVGE